MNLPLKDFLSVLQGDVHSEVAQRLHELFGVDVALKGKETDI